MNTILQIVDGLETTIEQATGLRAFPYVPEDVNPPMLFVVPPAVTRGAMARGQMELSLELIAFTSRAVDRVGQRALIEYTDFTGSRSVWKAIDDTPTLGLTNVHAAVMAYRPLGIDEIAVYGYFGGAFEVQILAST